MTNYPKSSYPVDSPGPRQPVPPARVLQDLPVVVLEAVSIIRLQNPMQGMTGTRKVTVHVS